MSHNGTCTGPECKDCYERVNHIKCDVKNCTYHTEDDCCHADIIHVTPSFAASEKDTACGTFQARS